MRQRDPSLRLHRLSHRLKRPQLRLSRSSSGMWRLVLTLIGHLAPCRKRTKEMPNTLDRL